MKSSVLIRSFAITGVLLTSSVAWANDKSVLSDAVLADITAGAYAGYAAGGIFTLGTQSGVGSTATTQQNTNSVSNRTTIGSSGAITTIFSANSRVRGTVSATGTGVSTATAIGVSSVGATQVP